MVADGVKWCQVMLGRWQMVTGGVSGWQMESGCLVSGGGRWCSSDIRLCKVGSSGGKLCHPVGRSW
jgi:hypothetical protein